MEEEGEKEVFDKNKTKKNIQSMIMVIEAYCTLKTPRGYNYTLSKYGIFFMTGFVALVIF